MKPWREIAVPHRDVLEGTFQQSEFAADITAVHSGKATKEYQEATAFFERTFITEVKIGTGRARIRAGLLSPFLSPDGRATWWAPHRLVVELAETRGPATASRPTGCSASGLQSTRRKTAEPTS